MRDVACERTERHEEPHDAKEKHDERHDQKRQQKDRRRQAVTDRQFEDEQHDEADQRIDAGTDRRGPRQRFRREDRFLDEVRMFVQQAGRAIREFAEEIEDDEAGEDRQRVDADAGALCRCRNTDGAGKNDRVETEHDERAEDRPKPAENRAAKARGELAPHDGANQLAVVPRALDGNDRVHAFAGSTFLLRPGPRRQARCRRFVTRPSTFGGGLGPPGNCNQPIACPLTVHREREERSMD